MRHAASAWIRFAVTDVSQTKAQSVQSPTGTNFRTAVNASGTTNATGIGIVRAQSAPTVTQ